MFENIPCSRHDCNPLNMIALRVSWTVVVHLDSERDVHALKTQMQIQKKNGINLLAMLQQHWGVNVQTNKGKNRGNSPHKNGL